MGGSLARALLVTVLLLGACSGRDASQGNSVDALRRQVDALQARVEKLQREQRALQQQLQSQPGSPVLEELRFDEGPGSLDAAEEVENADYEEPVAPATPRERAIASRSRRVEEAGLTTEEYVEMERLADSIRQQQVEEDYLRRREAYNRSGYAPQREDRLRAELGDDAYERYLYATGRPNRVSIGEVLPGSAAEQAGLAPGDVILNFDGEQVFSFSEVRKLTYRGEPGEAVLLEVRRGDDSTYQVSIPRGPLGITGRGLREVPE